MRTALLGMGLYLLAQLPLWQPLLRAQCVSREAFRARLQAITAPGIDVDSVRLKPQRESLKTWLLDWDKCYPKADSSYVDALNQLSLIHCYFAYVSDKNYAPAIACAQQAIRIYRHPNLALRNSDLIAAYSRLGVAYDYAGESERSIASLAKVIELGKDAPSAYKSVSSAYPYVVFHYYSTGDYEKALQYAEAGEKFGYRTGNAAITSKLLEQKSQVLSQLGRYEEARSAIQSAITLIQKLPKYHRTLAGEEKLLGGILYDMGRPDESLPHYNRAYALAKKHKDESLSDYATTLGGVYLDLGDDARALGYFQEALRIDRSDFSKSILLDYMGVLRRKQRDFDLALKYHQQGLNNLSIDYPETDIDDLPPAQSIRSEAHPDYFLIIVQDKADTWLEYAKYQENDRQILKNAWRTYMLADSMIDIMRGQHSGDVSKLLWRNRARNMYGRAVETCYLLNDPAAALHFFEKSRAVLLNDQLNDQLAEQSLPKKDMESLQHLRRELRFLQKRWQENPPSDTNAARLGTQRLEVHEKYEKLVGNLEKKNPNYRQFRNDDHVPGLGTIRQNLLTGSGPSAFLSYFIGDSTMYGICIDSKSFVFKKLNRTEYQRHIGKFTESLVSRAAQNTHWRA
ncbi:tetratricopeptide repeat protein [Persicitalea sp.]|uniref:tetratricopeptide repeat protein n=1 Tax=Persicitalea sp. TaxID=3100273 RepID=UPI003593811D